MKRQQVLTAGLLAIPVAGAIVCISLGGGLNWGRLGGEGNDSAPEEANDLPVIRIDSPLNETLFPPELPPPIFKWTDPHLRANSWSIELRFEPEVAPLRIVAADPHWRPGVAIWEDIKQRSVENAASVLVEGFDRRFPERVLSRGSVSFATSKDAVDASLFYREVNLPFVEAVKDPSQIRWRFGSIASAEPPPIVLDRLPVCGNCHSFSGDGRVMGMDVDYANSKGSYVITETRAEMVLSPEEVMTWDDYLREDGELTFGLLSQVSPDGRVVVSTVKDKSVFVPQPGLAFSQLFFPIKGILVIYDRETRTFAPLPGADDPAYVQSNPVWSPDGEHLVFARAKAYSLSNMVAQGKALLTPEECREFTRDGKPFRYDLYRIPYNGGRGGKPEPLEGASDNERSNYFPRYSPDGKWIVFCQAANYMLLQPDSELYIIPSEGGRARRLRANTALMNSWHSWSPNSRWLVFSSKVNSPYTQLFLTHIDEHGESTPPVDLSHLTAPDRAANIPEFVRLPPNGIASIRENFLNDYSFERAGNEFYRAGDPEQAIVKFQEALQLNPKNSSAHQRLGFLLYNVKHQFEEGLTHTTEALRLDPMNGFAHSDLGMALLNQRKPEEALRHFQSALKTIRVTPGAQYQPHLLRYSSAQACMQLGRYAEAALHLEECLRLAPAYPEAHYLRALASIFQGQLEQALQHYARALSLKPEVDTSVTFHEALAAYYARTGRFPEATRSAEQALKLARASKKEELAEAISTRLAHYRAQAVSR